MKKMIGTVGACGLLLMLSACGSRHGESDNPEPVETVTTAPAENTDPRKGAVTINDPSGEYFGVTKLCDGTTLIYVYRNTGTDVITESPECAPQ